MIPGSVYIDGVLQDFTVESWSHGVKGEGKPVRLTAPSASFEIELTDEQFKRFVTAFKGIHEKPKCRCCGK